MGLKYQSYASLQRGRQSWCEKTDEPSHRQRVAQISAELSIHVLTLYNRRKTWRLQEEVVSVPDMDPEGW
jgi:hypothetical protein